jgi:hypothetical protein
MTTSQDENHISHVEHPSLDTFDILTEDYPLVNGKKRSIQQKKKSFAVGSLSTLALVLIAASGSLIAYQRHAAKTRARTSHTSSMRGPLHNANAPIIDKGSKYTGTQFISFTINTFGGFANKGECEGRQVDASTGTCYLGNNQNITEDVEHRLNLLYEVLDKLKADVTSEEPKIDHRSDILKIFMLPEFYLRGPNGAYPMEELLDNGILLDTADEIHQYISVPEFSDYLFVFGTVIAYSKADTNNAAPYRQWDVPTMQDDEVLYYNFAPVFKGGPDSSRHKYIFTKQSISSIDFLSNVTMLPNPTNANVKTYDRVPDSFKYMLESRDAKLIENNVMQVDGIRIGVEVCLDHKMGVLWEHLQKTNDDLVDVLLITSAGMAIEFGPNPIVPGGVVYMSDGGATSAACWRPNQDTKPFSPEMTCRVPVPKGIKHFPPVTTIGNGNYYSSFFTMSACQDVLDFPRLEGYYSLYQTQGCAYSLSDFGIGVMDEMQYYLPSTEFYPTVDLPKHA